MIRLVKKDGEYFLQERQLKIIDRNPWWKPWGDDFDIVYTDWQTAETVDLDQEIEE